MSQGNNQGGSKENAEKQGESFCDPPWPQCILRGLNSLQPAPVSSELAKMLIFKVCLKNIP